MSSKPVLSPVDCGRPEPQEAAPDSSAESFVDPYPRINLPGLFIGLIYSALVVGSFIGIGYLAAWIAKKVVGWL